MCCRERWQRYKPDEKVGQVMNVIGKLVNEADDLQETMKVRKEQLLKERGLDWRLFRSYVDTACMYMVSHEWRAQDLHVHVHGEPRVACTGSTCTCTCT